MSQPVSMVEIWRGPFLESAHSGHAVICDDTGQIVQAWGNPDQVTLSRSSSKMIQALPLITSGAARAASLAPEQLSLACASHSGAKLHTQAVRTWLGSLDLSEHDLRCGSHYPFDRDSEMAMISSGETPCQCHHNCSGKHTGFLTLNKHIKGGSEYFEPDHPVQKAVLEAFERTTGQSSPGFGIDGCSVPNFASTLHGMARAMAHFAASPSDSAEAQLHQAMRLYPEFVAGEGRACTELMRAMDGKVAIKTGAEGFFIAIIPEKKLGVALKITDGTTRASECAIAAILVKLGVLEPEHPVTQRFMNVPIKNARGIGVGWIRPGPALL
ncbi:MAG: asparaginase [Roseobacter sp.]